MSRYAFSSKLRTRQQIEDSKEERLYFAIQNGDDIRLKQLLTDGCNPDHKFEGTISTDDAGVFMF